MNFLTDLLSGRIGPRPRFWSLAGLILCLSCTSDPAPPAEAVAPPALLAQGHPRSYFFRYPEAFAIADMPYERWEKAVDRLMGIEGKVLREELVSMPDRALTYYRRYKQTHPDQLVLIHFNGRDMDPVFAGDRFFAGHWLYNEGTRALDPLNQADSVSTFRVADLGVFLQQTGFTGDQSDDIGICRLDAAGRPDWHQSEQVKLLAIDSLQGTLTVRRGQYGSHPQAFEAGQTYLAAHSWGGPWGHPGANNLLWMYNFSTACPRDSQDQTCTEVLAQLIGEYFEPGGLLADFDGIQFDMLSFDPLEQDPRRADCDADGRGDDGWVGGINTYGAGVQTFCAEVRRRLGPGRIIQGDGQDINNQRAIGHLNGVETEGWPVLWDHRAETWSTGVNTLRFWAAFSHRPSFNYLNQKYVGPGALDMPYGLHRLIMAAGTGLDGVLTYSYFPEKSSTGLAALYEEGSQERVAQMSPAELLPIWDEYVGGLAQQPGWMGQPLEPPRWLALETENCLAGQDLLPLLEPGEARVEGRGEGLLISPPHDTARTWSVSLRGLPTDQPDHRFLVKVRAPEPWRGYPAGTPRMMWMRPREQPFDRVWDLRSFFWEQPFEAGFYFRPPSPAYTLVFEGAEAVEIEGLALYQAADVILRRFEHGLVMANPADHPVTVNLTDLFPGERFRKIQGSPRQDPAFNDGSELPEQVSIPARSGLFAWREKAPEP